MLLLDITLFVCVQWIHTDLFTSPQHVRSPDIVKTKCFPGRRSVWRQAHLWLTLMCAESVLIRKDLGERWGSVHQVGALLSQLPGGCHQCIHHGQVIACMQAVSAGIRPQLDRTQEAGGSALRAAVLSVAQQQKLATCTALLREVAMAYGFALHIDPEVGEAAAGRKTPCVSIPQEAAAARQFWHVSSVCQS